MASISKCIFFTTPLKYQTFLLKPLNLTSKSRIQTAIFQINAKKGKNKLKTLGPRAIREREIIDVDVIEPALTPRPGMIVESDKLPFDVSKRAMEAVDAFGGRVTIGDVASKAGLKLSEALKALQALASDTNGFLEVSDEGDVLYVFPKNYRSKLAAKSFMMKIEPSLEKGKSAAEYVIRVSFGTALIASIVIVYTAIIAALLSSRSDKKKRGSRGGSSFNPAFNFMLSSTDIFGYWDPYYHRKRHVQTENKGVNFIESIFSFVFGDGDPNQGIEEERWKLIGQYIAKNGGVVTAEELAPYLDVQTTENDESYILPVLLRFDGKPEVDEEGNILYRFASLQRTASSLRSGSKEYVGTKWTDLVGGLEKFFEEKTWQFSKTSSKEKAFVIGLGGLNLFGVIIFGAISSNTEVTPKAFITFVTAILPLLQIYAGSFFAIPLIRWFFVRYINSQIEKRNLAREAHARTLEKPELSLRRKLLSARDMAQSTIIGKDRIVYSSNKDLVDQDCDTIEWAQKIRETEKFD